MKLNLKFAAAMVLAASIASPAFAQTAGQATFSSKCAMCHGADGLSQTPAGKALHAKSLLDPAVLKASDATLTGVIKTGKGSMPAFGGQLSAAQIKALLVYIHTLQKK